MIKKLLFFLMLSWAFTSQASLNVKVTQSTNDIHEHYFAKEPNMPDMNVHTKIGHYKLTDSIQISSFFVEALVLPGDLEGMPINAKFTGMELDGGIIKAGSATCFNFKVYVKKLTPEAMTKPTGECYVGGYNKALTYYEEEEPYYDGQAIFDDVAAEGGLGSICNVNFSRPYTYKGDSLRIGLDMDIPDPMHFYYQQTSALISDAVSYHVSNFVAIVSDVPMPLNNVCFYPSSMLATYANRFGMAFTPNTLPAFIISYYTNDISGTYNCDGDAVISLLVDGDTIGTAEVSKGDSFAFEALDNELTYTLCINGETVQEITFDEQDTDIALEINEETLLRGDVNRDGKVNVTDVTALINMILGVIEKDMESADVNGDGKINVSDVTALINIILGIL
ncbi:MAG: dockerin type I repeat-containing protein [Muribaculaceae bacterium]|nr:dockerin type I repeat-containing protein [Muribaculaceae bacterium]